VVTGTRHYFDAPFIDKLERRARADTELRRHASTLLAELAESPHRTASQWAAHLQIPSDWVGRGIRSEAQDDQIVAAIKTETLLMPLWGASLDKAIAEGFGSRFIFELRGTFPAIPAWAHSEIKREEYELIVGGRYSIDEVIDTRPGSTRVLLRFENCIAPITPTPKF